MMSTVNNINLFGSRIRESILTLLFLNKDKKFYLREIATNLSLSPGAVQRELRNILRLKLISSEKSGNRIYYYLNQDNPIYEDLDRIVRKQGGLVSLLKSSLEKIKDINIVFIYGSYVSGGDSKNSDIDLFVIGNISSRALSLTLKKAENMTGREIAFYLISAAEFKQKYKQKNHFINSVLKEKTIFIKGNSGEIQKIIG